jgi:hypothetical protein
MMKQSFFQRRSRKMGLEAEVEALRRENRRLKVTLFSTFAVLMVAVVMAVGLVGFAAARARTQARLALEMERRARVQAEEAIARAQTLLDDAADKNSDGN